MRKKTLVAGLLLAALVLAGAGVVGLASWLADPDPLRGAYDAVAVGTPQARVLDRLGPPGPFPPYTHPTGEVTRAWSNDERRTMLIVTFDRAGLVSRKQYVYHDPDGTAHTGDPPPWWWRMLDRLF